MFVAAYVELPSDRRELFVRDRRPGEALHELVVEAQRWIGGLMGGTPRAAGGGRLRSGPPLRAGRDGEEDVVTGG